jgi:hypothetical protein
MRRRWLHAINYAALEAGQKSLIPAHNQRQGGVTINLRHESASGTAAPRRTSHNSREDGKAGESNRPTIRRQASACPPGTTQRRRCSEDLAFARVRTIVVDLIHVGLVVLTLALASAALLTLLTASRVERACAAAAAT